LKIQKKAFTLVELIVVITILAILWTLAFVSFQSYNNDARNSKILYDVRNLTKAMESKLSTWDDLDSLVSNYKTTINGVNTGSTIMSWAYVLWNLKYEVWSFDFTKLSINWSDFVYEDQWIKRDYIFAYTKTPSKLLYEFAWQIYNAAWKYDVVIAGNYYSVASSDTKWLISENWYDIWLQNWQTLTWSLY
jgi:prepilin-type N-terminal cleavage/methylation domain-containing protein